MMIKLIIGLAIIACIAPLFIKGPDGKPLMSLDDWAVDVDGMAASLKSGAEAVTPDAPVAPTAVYRWQDDEGNWHFSDTPVDGVAASQIELSEVNVMDPFVPPAEAQKPARAEVQPTLPGVGGVSASELQDMMDTVNNLQQTVDERKANMDKLVMPEG